MTVSLAAGSLAAGSLGAGDSMIVTVHAKSKVSFMALITINPGGVVVAVVAAIAAAAK